MENVINIVDFLLGPCLSKFFSLYQKHCFPGLKLTNFYFYGQDKILFLAIFQQIFLLRLNAINCAYCLSIMMHFRYAVKSNRTIVKREVTKGLFQSFVVTAIFTIVYHAKHR